MVLGTQVTRRELYRRKELCTLYNRKCTLLWTWYPRWGLHKVNAQSMLPNRKSEGVDATSGDIVSAMSRQTELIEASRHDL